MKLTVAISQGEEMLIGQVREVPGVVTQGASVDEVMENIQDALEIYFQDIDAGETAINSELNLKDVILTMELEFA
ncbi:type II toxin-antitoxin system HicB family antitoxin [Dyadobacter jiangsuensis]